MNYKNFYFQDRNCEILNKNKEVIQQELSKIKKDMYIPLPKFSQMAGIESDGYESQLFDWKMFPLYILGKSADFMKDMFPNTIATLDEMECLSAYVSFLEPDAKIPFHIDSDYDNAVTRRYHVCTKAIKGGSFLQCEKEKIIYEEGLVFGFDNGKKHKAENNSNESRIVLLADILYDKKIEDLSEEQYATEIYLKSQFQNFLKNII